MTIGNLPSSNAKDAVRIKSNNPLQTTGPKATILNGMEVSKDVFWDLKGNLRLQTQFWKFLLSKLVYEGPNSLTEQEEFVLPLLYVRLSSVKDFGWVEKNFVWFEQTTRIFKYFSQFQRHRDTFPWSQSVVNNPFFSGSLYSACAFFGRRTILNVRMVLRKINLRLKKRPRPPNRIGVGYRDHGTARDVAFDGSPSWQEVAVAHPKSESTNPTQRERYRTYLWKIQGKKVPYQNVEIDSL